MNFLTKESYIYLCGENTIWDTASYGEAGSGVTGRLKNNPGVTKGGQTVLLVNLNNISLCAYIRRHKLHSNPPGCTVMGNIELNNHIEGLNPMIQKIGGKREFSKFSQHNGKLPLPR